MKLIKKLLKNSGVKKLYSEWFSEKENYGNKNYFEIIKPMKFPNYKTLIKEFIKYELGDLVSINNNGKWNKRFKRHVWKKEIEELSKIAEEDTFLRGPLELYFSEGKSSIEKNEK